MSFAASHAGFLSGGGDMGELIRAKDWSTTPVGPPQTWPQSLRTALGILLDSGYAMYIAWGPEFTQFYNDAYRPILGNTKHPGALGASSRDTFPEIWEFIGPMFRRVMEKGENTSAADQILPLNRYGFLEECYFTFSYSAIRAEAGAVGGVFVTCIETTKRVMMDRRMKTLRDLAALAGQAKTVSSAFAAAAEIISQNRADIPAAVILSSDGAVLAGSGEVTASTPRTGIIQHGEAIFGRPAYERDGLGPAEQCHALALPLASGTLILALSARIALEGDYEAFLRSVSDHISNLISSASSYQQERQRAEALAEVDRAKTLFFSNVSHEFRTPLTLILGPVEELLNQESRLAEPLRDRLQLVHRNTLRLLRLVNTLLEFSRIEAGRVSAQFEPSDLAAITADIASVFRSAIEKAGLRYDIQCDPLKRPVSIDRSMWEKIVLNLLSNAFKFTFEGSIRVLLREQAGEAVLEVIDTGTGIPASELPKIFDRFHRVEGSRGRTIEGTGIGLALVSELVRLHGGKIEAESRLAGGSTFRVRLPIQATNASSLTAPEYSVDPLTAQSFTSEVDRWSAAGPEAPKAPSKRKRVLVVDDNRDMRGYVGRLLESEFAVLEASNGQEALDAAHREHPDLILSDVMMPGIDGIELTKRIRNSDTLPHVPIILLSARVGEEARLDGLSAGADDYLQKPFSAKELLARVKLQIGMAGARERVARLEHSLLAEADAERQRWRELLMWAPAMIAVLRGPDHVFEFANPQYCAAVKRNAQDLLGKPVVEALPELQDQPFPKLLDGVFQTGKEFLESEVSAQINIGGVLQNCYFNLAYLPWRDSGGSVVGVFVHALEITELVNSRKRAEEGERQLRVLAESIPQLVWSTNADGYCDFLSSQWVEYTGIPEQQQLGFGWLDTIHPEDRQHTAAAWKSAVEGLAPYDLEYRIRRFDGTYRWFKTRGTPVKNANGQVLKWFGTCTDIEDQLAAAAEREALLKREQAARATAELLNRVGPALAGELDLQKLVQRVTDLATELIGAEFGALFHNVIDENGGAYMLYTLSGAPRAQFDKFPMPRATPMFGPTFRGEKAVLCADVTKDPRYGKWAPHHGIPKGHLPVCSYLAVPVVSRNGQVIGGLFFGHSLPGQFTQQHADLVTGIAAQAAIAIDNANLFAEAQRAQTELEETNNDLRQANQDLEQFAYAAAHDLQEPLRMVTTYTELLARRLGSGLDERLSTYVKYITGASSRMILLLQDLLAYTETSKQSDLPPQLVDLNVAAHKATANLASAIMETGAKITIDPLANVLGREAGFIQLFQNLIGNAIKYSKPGEKPRINVFCEREAAKLLLKIQDNGIGIAPEYQKQIFGVFRRLHGSEIPGTGIGLAICQRVVERAGGRIWVESEPGVGSTFIAELPAQ